MNDLRIYEISPGLLIQDLGGRSVGEIRAMFELVEDHPYGCGMCGGPRGSDTAARWPTPQSFDRLDGGPTGHA
jgi:hypothetical protein